jgi:arylsulfatase A-like enzyme
MCGKGLSAALLLVCGWLIPGRMVHAVPQSPPNIVVIFVDDLGYGDIGPYGAVKQKTPALDRMAAEGLRLTSFYSAPVCSVARAQLLTGCYGARVSVPGVYFPGSAQGLNPAEKTIAEYLRERGYRTACIGKWHLGDQPEFLPLQQGFDRYLGIPYSNDMQRKAATGGEGVVPLVRDNAVERLLKDADQSDITRLYTAEALQFIRDAGDQPFFLYLPHTAVHTPIWPGPAFRGRSANGRFGDWVEEVDWSVGQILDELRARKLDSRTLVLFTSDNGPWLIRGADGGSAGPLRGGKGSTWEGGVRVPTVAWWPGRIPAGLSSDRIAGTIDVLPTCVELSGGTPEPARTLDGRSLVPVLFEPAANGATEQGGRDWHAYFSGYNLQAVRRGPWKLALAAQPATAADAMDNPQVIPRLYNLETDRGEQRNVAAEHPELVRELQVLAEQVVAEIGGNEPQQRRPAGSVKQPRTLYPVEEPAAGQRKAATVGPFRALELAEPRIGLSLSGRNAPQIAGRGFRIQLQFQRESESGVLAAQGGTAVGWSVWLSAGQPVFSVRMGETLLEVRGPQTVAGRMTELTAELQADGKLRLTVVGEQGVELAGAGVLQRQPQEDFCVGTDNGQPVARYAAGEFRGRIQRVRVTAP